MTKRTYRQYCAIARALDVVGERWTLLIIRELLTGPKRYSDLLDHLPGLGTNLLANRLRQLERGGVIVKGALPPPAGSSVYKLTERGRALEPVLLALSDWGRPLLGELDPNESFSVASLMLAMKKSFRPDQAVELEECYEYRIDGDVFQIRVDRGRIELELGTPWRATMTLTTSEQVLLRLASGALSRHDAVRDGLVKVEGSLDAFDRTFGLFGVE